MCRRRWWGASAQVSREKIGGNRVGGVGATAPYRQAKRMSSVPTIPANAEFARRYANRRSSRVHLPFTSACHRRGASHTSFYRSYDISAVQQSVSV